MDTQDQKKDHSSTTSEGRNDKPQQEPPKNQRIDHDDPVEEASDESFPASDPPAY